MFYISLFSLHGKHILLSLIQCKVAFSSPELHSFQDHVSFFRSPELISDFYINFNHMPDSSNVQINFVLKAFEKISREK